jgi:hypothetical protein
MSKVAQFITRYPSVQGYTLICVCEEINRITKAGVGVDGILEQALRLENAAQYLVRVCERFQSQKQTG